MRLGALVLLALVASQVSAQAQPVVSRQANRLHLKALPPLLSHPEVEEFLASGLTTNFVLEVTVRDGLGAKAVGGALVEIRYELWDEVYLVRWADLRGQGRRASLPTLAKLVEWWRELDLAAAEVTGLANHEPWQVRIRLSVLPFSSEELLDTKRWFNGSLETKGGEAGTSDLQWSKVLNVLIATSIGRESSLTFDWKLSQPSGGGR